MNSRKKQKDDPPPANPRDLDLELVRIQAKIKVQQDALDIMNRGSSVSWKGKSPFEVMGDLKAEEAELVYLIKKRDNWHGKN